MLLLDEPFGALDAKVRKELRRWLRRLHDELHITSIFVTHDQEEALEVADRVVVMNKGRIEQVGTPEEVYDHPATPFVVAHSRPHEIEIERFSPGLAGIPVQLNRLLLVGPTARLELEREDSAQIIEAELPAERARHLKLRQGETLLIRPRKMQVFVERDGEPAKETLPQVKPGARLEELPVFGTVIS